MAKLKVHINRVESLTIEVEIADKDRSALMHDIQTDASKFIDENLDSIVTQRPEFYLMGLEKLD